MYFEKALEKAWKNAKKPSEREHVTPFFRDPQNGFNLTNLEHQEDFSHLRYTVDKIEDLKLVKEIMKNIPIRPILMQNIIDLYKIINTIKKFRYFFALLYYIVEFSISSLLSFYKKIPPPDVKAEFASIIDFCKIFMVFFSSTEKQPP